jgi:hypothetical protein
LMNK